VSSTDVRASIDRGASLAGMVPDAVAAYIDAHRLYRREAHGH
jgi:nicotinic acid mononucleotide adenylyltransferase